jgi:hypothetical protein
MDKLLPPKAKKFFHRNLWIGGTFPAEINDDKKCLVKNNDNYFDLILTIDIKNR